MLSLLIAPALAAFVDLGGGVLVDPDAALAYIASPRGGVDALNATSGKVVWHSDAIDVPLAGVAYLIVGRRDSADGLQIVTLHPDGSLGASCAPVQLPPWANSRVTAVAGASTSVLVTVGKGAIDARWVAEAGEHEFEGAGRCDLATGVWTSGPWRASAAGVASTVVIGSLTLARDGDGLIATKASGKKRWRVPVRVLDDRGPAPP